MLYFSKIRIIFIVIFTIILTYLTSSNFFKFDDNFIAKKINLDVVPIVGNGTLSDMVRLCRDGMTSKWGDFQSEGLIAKPKVEMRSRNGDRVITKLKTRDFLS